MSQKETLFSKVKTGVIVAVIVAVILGGFGGGWKIYNAVANVLPNEIRDVKRVANSTNTEFKIYKQEHSSAHSEINKRIDNNRDNTSEKFAIVTDYFAEIKSILKTNWQFKELYFNKSDRSENITLK